MLQTKALFSTGKDDWETPQDLFDALDAEFHFTLDACATPENAKHPHFYTECEDGLLQDWAGETVWCNPPYSSGRQNDWVRKCYEESLKPGTTVVLLVPARTDTARFHDYVWGKAELRFIRGRLKFVGADAGAPFPSMICVYRSELGGDDIG